jgi:hypothetical protein
MFLFSPILATFSAYLLILEYIILIILGKEYKSRSSSVCSFLCPHITPSLFGPNILLSTLFSDTISQEEYRLLVRNIPEDDILHSHRRENLKSYIALTGWTL